MDHRRFNKHPNGNVYSISASAATINNSLCHHPSAQLHEFNPMAQRFEPVVTRPIWGRECASLPRPPHSQFFVEVSEGPVYSSHCQVNLFQSTGHPNHHPMHGAIAQEGISETNHHFRSNTRPHYKPFSSPNYMNRRCDAVQRIPTCWNRDSLACPGGFGDPERIEAKSKERGPTLLRIEPAEEMDSAPRTPKAKSTSYAMHEDARLLLEAASQVAHEVRTITPVSSPVSSVASKKMKSRQFMFAEYVASSDLVSMELYGTVSDLLFVSMAQMKLCRLTEEDRFGNYKHRQVGFVGMCCKFCGGLPGFGRHFPGSFQSLLSGSHCVRIVKHMRSECRSCPPRIREFIEDIGSASESQNCTRSQSQMDHGSRKMFVAHVWSKLQEAQSKESLEPPRCAIDRTTIGATPETPLCTTVVCEDEDLTWGSVFDSGDLVSTRDLHLVPNTTLFALAQMISWPLTLEDKIGRHKDQRLGFVGMCCKHCGGKTGQPRYGRYFPPSLKTLAKPASCDRVANHIASECPKCPANVRSVMRKLQHQELSSNLRYGSRNIFFQRLWTRLHGDDKTLENAPTISQTNNKQEDSSQQRDHRNVQIPWDRLLQGSSLVSVDDRGLIQDGQLVAMAQLEPCQLKLEDRAGWYKDRPIGFAGLACRHCKGRPGIGRYFPNTLRTFSQNNYCQIVSNHVKKDCRGCPEDLRVMLVDVLTKTGSLPPKRKSEFAKGSRKALYDRIWLSIHGAQMDGTEVKSSMMVQKSKRGVRWCDHNETDDLQSASEGSEGSNGSCKKRKI